MGKYLLKPKKKNFWKVSLVSEKNAKLSDLADSLGQDWAHQVLIRHAEKTDLVEMEWEGEFARLRNVYAEVYDRMQKGLSIMWVAELPAWGILGQVFVQLLSKQAEMADGKQRAYVHSFRVRSEFQDAGLGRVLMDQVEADLKLRGFTEVCLNVAKDNPKARSIYEHFGYQVINKDPGIWWYYDHNNELQHVNEPSWRMLKELNI